MRRSIQIVIFSLIIGLTACDEPIMPKPENLIKKKQMIDMLVDIHVAEATFNKFRYDSIMRNNSSVNFYYSVLDKYQVTDSVFERSYIYYASVPKDFEKMYREVMNKLSVKEQELSGRKEQLLEFDEEEIPRNAR